MGYAMQITRYTDYSLRVLMYLGLHPDRLCTINEIAVAHGISENHLMKLIHQLGLLGYVKSTRGRRGGLELAKSPKRIKVGKLIRETEVSFNLVECFDLETNTCQLAGVCVLADALQNALDAFLKVLDGYTLADLLASSEQMETRLANSTVG